MILYHPVTSTHTISLSLRHTHAFTHIDAKNESYIVYVQEMLHSFMCVASKSWKTEKACASYRELLSRFFIFCVTAKKRSASYKNATIEVGVYLDRFFLAEIEEKFRLSTTQQLMDLVSLKWSGVSSVHLVVYATSE